MTTNFNWLIFAVILLAAIEKPLILQVYNWDKCDSENIILITHPTTIRIHLVNITEIGSLNHTTSLLNIDIIYFLFNFPCQILMDSSLEIVYTNFIYVTMMPNWKYFFPFAGVSSFFLVKHLSTYSVCVTSNIFVVAVGVRF